MYILEEGHLPVEIVKSIQGQDLVIVQLQVNGKKCEFEVDSGARDNFCSETVWKKLGQPVLQPPTLCYVTDTGNPLPVIGSFQTKTPLPSSPSQVFNVTFNVTTLNQLRIATLDLDVRRLMKELRTTTVQRSGPLKVIMSLIYGYNMLATSNVRYSLICSSLS